MLAHLGIGLTARLLLICYAEIQDKVSEVQYTDIDYKVFTDAARHVFKSESPYERYTYRYTPLIAYMLTPNVFFHPAWGKFLFSILDVVVAILIKKIVSLQYPNVSESMCVKCALAWLYNPLAIVISTRGNGDSLAAVLVILTILFLKKENYFLAGVIHGVAIHTRLYPIAFSLAMYSSIPSDYKCSKTSFSKIIKLFIPNSKRLKLVFGCVLALSWLTFMFYKLYGYTYLDESLLFHLRRRDIRHNFSVYFYQQYLSYFISTNIYQRVLTLAPQLILLFNFSLLYGSSRDLLFCLLCQAVVMVAYNSVLTCQYFIWFLSLLPLCLPHLKIGKTQCATLAFLWLAAQLAWLLPAYWLEFKGRNTFMYIWLQGIAFFCANMAVLARLITSYQPRKKQE
ncbi:GPI mannosyltransferase 1-like [Macrosteles quadrilineatus]|uniref:GPI mannosyltransferase 1-like n=1 Tax=Macrosteles quadrilineatus TaxID=74068 RepID=UPI0023E150D2|nr:GPI mannosyltransferase 1-like [Macrosteles quadrilineatus]